MERTRSLMYLMDRIVIISSYSKMASITGLESYIPRFIPDLVIPILLRYFLVVQPCLAMLAAQAGHSQRKVQRLMEHLFVTSQGPMTIPQLSGWLETMFVKEAGFGDMGVRSWRKVVSIVADHVARIISISIRCQGDDDNDEEETSAQLHQQANHSISMAKRQYVSHSTSIQSISASLMVENLQASRMWHLVTGIEVDQTAVTAAESMGRAFLKKAAAFSGHVTQEVGAGAIIARLDKIQAILEGHERDTINQREKADSKASDVTPTDDTSTALGVERRTGPTLSPPGAIRYYAALTSLTGYHANRPPQFNCHEFVEVLHRTHTEVNRVHSP
ncbi:hypothetical protein SeMB42_g01190 [Synchytrium endobioticum]|uniref:Uncharacterized protein n=1 Tax=Synchytrium endobioticum TaxID=286115 RepID=A0A507DG76_9FUNG|nr:hypothetical protein SeLEV6574_g00749 [Synchytrium endobioticum]TPX52785.1 hypothetical protein SeMB42_g01190 [Synchytrium endobioticum]